MMIRTVSTGCVLVLVMLSGSCGDQVVVRETQSSCGNGEVVEYVIRGEEKVEYIKLLARYVQNFVEHKLNEYGTGTEKSL